jgi:hypothetical protein
LGGTAGFTSTGTGAGDIIVDTGSAGGDAPHNNMPPYIVMNYIIRYRKEGQGIPGPNEITVNTVSTVDGLLKGSGGKVSAASAGTDYEAAIGTKGTAFNKNYETTATNIKISGTQSVGTLDTIARGDHVHPSEIETGSNANGRYTKFSDGTLICHKDVLAGYGAAEGALNTVRWTFPCEFVGGPTVTYGCYSSAAGYPTLLYHAAFPTTTYIDISIYLPAGRPNYIYGSVQAIGRWKA